MITGIISILWYLQCFGTLSASVTAKMKMETLY